MVGCVNDGWYSVHNQLLRNLQEYKSLMCALSTQITSLFTTFHKGDISQPTFLSLEVCIQRFAKVRVFFLIFSFINAFIYIHFIKRLLEIFYKLKKIIV